MCVMQYADSEAPESPAQSHGLVRFSRIVYTLTTESLTDLPALFLEEIVETKQCIFLYLNSLSCFTDSYWFSLEHFMRES